MKKRADRSPNRLADEAFKEAARKVVALAKQTGTPVILWEENRVREVDPSEVALPPEPRRRRKGRYGSD